MIITKKVIYRELVDYIMIAIGICFYAIGWSIFLLPSDVTTGGVAGLASIVYWWTNGAVPTYITYFGLNFILLAIALKILGLRFCIKTIYGVVCMTFFVALIRQFFPHPTILHSEPFMSCIIGSCFCGVGLGFALGYNGSSGGSDIVAAIINKYRDVSLGRVILLCDIFIVTLSYLVLHSWEQVIYGFVGLIITSFVLDQVINSSRQSVQFLIISEYYEEICKRVVEAPPHRGCTLIDAHGYYSGNDMKVLIIVAKRREASFLFNIIDDVDPNAFVTQSLVVGVYGNGFDRFKVKKKRKS